MGIVAWNVKEPLGRRWSGKIVKNHPQMGTIAVLKFETSNRVNIKVTVSLSGVIRGRKTATFHYPDESGANVQLSMNGTAHLSIEQWYDLGLAIREACDVLGGIPDGSEERQAEG